MKNKTIKYVLLVLMVWLGASNSVAQGDSLSHYVNVAIENNLTVQSDFLLYKASLKKIPQAGAFSDPELEMGFFLTPMEVLDGKQVADFTLMQMFPWFGTRKAARGEATEVAKATFEQFRTSRDNLVLEVKSTWYTLSDLHQQLRNLDDNDRLLTSLKSLLLNRVGGASSAMSDVLRVELEINELADRKQAVAAEILSGEAKFNALLNRNSQLAVTVPDSIEQLAFELDDEAILALIRERNPILGMIHAEMESFKLKIIADKKKSLPMIGVGLQYSLLSKRMDMGIPTTSMNGMDMVMPMVSFSLPLFRRKYNAQREESELMIQSGEAKYAQTLRMLQAEYMTLKQSLNDAARKVLLYQKQQGLALSTYQVAVKEFSAGRNSLIDVIDIHRQLLDYKLKLSQSVGAYNTTIAKFENLLSESETK